MPLSTKEIGAVTAVIANFNKNDLPRLLDIRRHLDGGDELDDFQFKFLESAIKKSRGSYEFGLAHPEFQTLIAQIASLFEQLAKKAVDNAIRPTPVNKV